MMTDLADAAISIYTREDEVEIELTDKRSGVFAVTIKMDPGAFLSAIARHGHVPCRFWWNDSGKVGSDREVKRVLVPFDTSGKRHPVDTAPEGYRTKETVAALLPFEIDGWSANERDMWNGHNRRDIQGVRYQEVSFVRFVRDGKPI